MALALSQYYVVVTDRTGKKWKGIGKEVILAKSLSYYDIYLESVSSR